MTPQWMKSLLLDIPAEYRGQLSLSDDMMEKLVCNPQKYLSLMKVNSYIISVTGKYQCYTCNSICVGVGSGGMLAIGFYPWLIAHEFCYTNRLPIEFGFTRLVVNACFVHIYMQRRGIVGGQDRAEKEEIRTALNVAWHIWTQGVQFESPRPSQGRRRAASVNQYSEMDSEEDYSLMEQERQMAVDYFEDDSEGSSLTMGTNLLDITELQGILMAR